MLREIDNRDDLPRFLNLHNLLGKGVEIGVFTGNFSETVLKTWHGKVLYLIDPYKHYDRETYYDSTQDREQEGVFAEARWKLKDFGARAQFMRLESSEAATKFSDGEIDWCHIDSNHSYEATTEDIELWWPKVKSGGVFSLHDCVTRLRDTNTDSANAIFDFAEKIDVRPHLCYCTSAFFIKP